jgi:predicted transposase/invertase (TIGR01784 family)
MSDDDEHEKYMEENIMLINPVERYCINKGRKEGLREGAKNGKLDMAKNMLAEGYPIEIVKISGLSKEDILNAK